MSNGKIKVAHWVKFNNSGMYKFAESIAKSEAMKGDIDSWLVNCFDPNGYTEVLDADVHVMHTHIPDDVREQLTKPLKVVWIGHGTPEYVFQRSVEEGLNTGYGAGDSWQLAQYWMQHADALVTFWPRHQAIWQSLCDKHTHVELLPFGVDKSFWHPVESQGRYVGGITLFTAENPDYTKWPLDLFLCWPWVIDKIPTVNLHAVYLPNDQARWWYPLINRNGAGFKCISAGLYLSSEGLRNAFVSTDYFIGLVRYGDCNMLAAQANATGAKMITYSGNEYSDFWIPEGDQRNTARYIVDILQGEIKPRKNKKSVADISETIAGLKKIYERII
jgi:hypothetical protein